MFVWFAISFFRFDYSFIVMYISVSAFLSFFFTLTCVSVRVWMFFEVKISELSAKAIDLTNAYMKIQSCGM